MWTEFTKVDVVLFCGSLGWSETGLRRVLDVSRQVPGAYAVFLKRLVCLLPGGFATWTPPRFFWTPFSLSRKDINRAAYSTINQISSNASRWWSSFVCSLRISLFRDVPEIYCDVKEFIGTLGRLLGRLSSHVQ